MARGSVRERRRARDAAVEERAAAGPGLGDEGDDGPSVPAMVAAVAVVVAVVILVFFAVGYVLGRVLL
jgi:hypothetical protein